MQISDISNLTKISSIPKINDINKTTYSFNPFKLNTPKQNNIKNTENNIESNLLIL